MTEVSEKEFPNPVLREAARMVAKGDAQSAIDLARPLTDGLNAKGPQDDTLLIVALKSGEARSVKLLLDAGADPNFPSSRAPLSVAASTASVEVIKMLLEKGATPDGTSGGQTALWRAAANNRFDVAELLLLHNASVDLADRDGVTPALAAARVDRFRMTAFLLDHGANPHAASSHGFTLQTWISNSTAPENSAEGKARSALQAKLNRVQ